MILKQLKVNREMLKLTISKFVIYRMVIYQQQGLKQWNTRHFFRLSHTHQL